MATPTGIEEDAFSAPELRSAVEQLAAEVRSAATLDDAAGSQPSRAGDGSPGESGRVGDPKGEPTVEVLRAKLDAAILAEAWDAVKAIRERIAQVEKSEAAQASSRRAPVFDLESERRRRTGG